MGDDVKAKMAVARAAQPDGPRRGRPKGLARYIRERTNDLSEQVNEMIRISLDQEHRGQIEAIKWLTERGFGRVPEIQAFAELDESEASAALQGLSSTELESLAKSLKKAS